MYRKSEGNFWLGSWLDVGEGESQQHDTMKQKMDEPSSLSCSSESCRYPCEQCTGTRGHVEGWQEWKVAHTDIWIDVLDSQGGALY